MAWSNLITIEPKTQWKFSGPTTSRFFRLRHTNLPTNPVAYVCQAEKLSDDTYQIYGIYPIAGQALIEVVELVSPAMLTDRAIGIRQKYDNNNWSIQVESNDFVTSQQSVNSVDYSPQFSTIRSDIAALSNQIMGINNTITAINSNVLAIKNNSTGNANNGVDPSFASVVLLMHFDGANNSRTFTDIKGKTISSDFNVTISTTQSKFGASSGYFLNGKNDVLRIANSVDFGFGTGNFTIEGFFYFANFASFRESIGIGSTFAISFRTDGKTLFYDGTDYVGNTQLTAQTWHHLAYQRLNGRLEIFLNGTKTLSQLYSRDMGTSQPLTIGYRPGSAQEGYSGYIDDFRITKGVGRYLDNFTVPTEPFPNQ